LKTKITAKLIAESNYTTEWFPKGALSADLTVFLQLAGGPFKPSFGLNGAFLMRGLNLCRRV